jgi:hypothetical protein
MHRTPHVTEHNAADLIAIRHHLSRQGDLTGSIRTAPKRVHDRQILCQWDDKPCPQNHLMKSTQNRGKIETSGLAKEG